MTPHGTLQDAPRRMGRPAATVSTADRRVIDDADRLPNPDIVAAFDPPPGRLERLEPLILRSFRSRNSRAKRGQRLPTSARAVLACVRAGHRRSMPRLPTAGRAGRAAASVLGIVVLSAALGQAAYAASGAGLPFYGIRVSIERAMLPGVDADSRVSAQLGLAARRLDEAEDAADRGDLSALTAALGSYRSDVDDLRIALQHRPDQSASAMTGLRIQLQRLCELASRVENQPRVDVLTTIRGVRQTLRVISPGERARWSRSDRWPAEPLERHSSGEPTRVE